MSLDILISGIGIAGPIAAYWLLRGNPNHRITIVERDRVLRTTGQSIDIRQPAVDIIRLMGLIDAIKAKTTHEAGISFVDEYGESFATFESTGDEDNQSFSSEFEVLRGDLVDIFYGKVKDEKNVRTVFGDYVKDYKQLPYEDGDGDNSEDGDGGRVEVVYANGRENEQFDLIIACDGQSSRIRRIMYDTLSEPRAHIVPFYNYCAYFTYKCNCDGAGAGEIPGDLCGDGQTALWYNSTGGRILFIRPDPTRGQCRANIIRQLLPSDAINNKRYRDGLRNGAEAFKEILREDFKDAGWISNQLLDGFQGAGDAAEGEGVDFYASETAQIRVPHLTKGKVALVGDAGYCPTPLTGMGTSLAIIGAYILAGELSLALSSNSSSNSNTNPDIDNDGARGKGEKVEQALKNYNSIMKPFSAKIQNIPTFIPRLANPQSAWGLWLSRTFLWFVANSGLVKLLSRLAGIFSIGGQTWKLPKYPKFNHEQDQDQDTENMNISEAEEDIQDKKTK